MHEPMRVVMFKPRFAPQVEAGTKRQTIRPTPKRPIPVGRLLSLREWSGKPYRSKHRVLREERCTAVTPIRIDFVVCLVGGRGLRHYELDAFAQADGFRSYEDMYEWFRETHGLPFEGVLIKWGEEATSDQA